LDPPEEFKHLRDYWEWVLRLMSPWSIWFYIRQALIDCPFLSFFYLATMSSSSEGRSLSLLLRYVSSIRYFPSWNAHF
jgi:hypothetical protein